MQNSGGTASLVLGILSILFSLLLAGIPFIGLACGIIGLILAVQARKNNPSPMATAGFICSIVGTVLSAIFLLLFVACIGIVNTAVTSIFDVVRGSLYY